MNRRSNGRRRKLKESEGAVIEDNGVVAQSPIPLSSANSKKFFTKIHLTYKGHWNCTGNASIMNNGITALMTFVDSVDRPILCGGPLQKECVFEQLHFHWAEDDQGGSEHSIDGTKYAAEAHLVHYNSKYANFTEASTQKDGLAVTGFLLKVCEVPNKAFQPLSDAIAHIPQKDQSCILSSDCLKWMLNINLNEYYTYRGSLTTEPYLESVTWIVYPNPVEISCDQVAVFRQMEGNERNKKIKCNARQLQSCPLGLGVYYVKPKTINRDIPVSFNTRSKL